MTGTEHVEVQVGGNHVEVKGPATRTAAILLLVDELNLDPDEVRAARARIGSDEEADEAGDRDE